MRTSIGRSMRTRIQKEFHFSAHHVLLHLKQCGFPDHPCARDHGHNYIVVFVFEGEPSPETGFILDYRSLDVIKAWIDTHLDHRSLNESIPRLAGVTHGGKETTAENLAAFLFHEWSSQFPELCEVRVSETPKTWASYGE